MDTCTSIPSLHRQGLKVPVKEDPMEFHNEYMKRFNCSALEPLSCPYEILFWTPNIPALHQKICSLGY